MECYVKIKKERKEKETRQKNKINKNKNTTIHRPSIGLGNDLQKSRANPYSILSGSIYRINQGGKKKKKKKKKKNKF